MANTETTGSIAPFGADVTEVVTAPKAVDAMTSFLETSALPIAAAVIVTGFVIYQVVRWYLSGNPFGSQDEITSLRGGQAGAIPAAQMPADGARRPWAKKAEKAEDAE